MITPIFIPDTAGVVFPASVRTAITSLTFSNQIAGVPHTIQVWAVPSGGSMSLANRVIPPTTIEGEDMFIWTGNEKFILEAGDALYAVCDAASSVSLLTSSLAM